MDKKTAQSTIDLVQQIGDALNKLTIISMHQLEKDEQIIVRKHLGGAMIYINDLLEYIVKQYPDLDPDKPKDSSAIDSGDYR